MKNVKNSTIALLAAAMMAACSSTRNAGLGGISGTTGMDSGSSADLSNTSETMNNISTDDSVNTLVYGSNSNSIDSNYDTRNSEYAYMSSYSSVPNVWAAPVVTDYSASESASPMYYIMNGYQGPLNYLAFDNFTSPEDFLPLAAGGLTRDVELSRIARLTSTNADVKAFADMVVKEYSGSSAELQAIAFSENIIVPKPAFAFVETPDFTSGSDTGYAYIDSYNNSDSFYGYPYENSYYTDEYPYSMYYGYPDENGNFTDESDGELSIVYNAGIGDTGILPGTGMSNNGMDSQLATANETCMLRNLTGRDFDRQYMRVMLQDHYQAVALLTSALQSGNSEVRDFAGKQLPALQAHLSQATTIYNSLL